MNPKKYKAFLSYSRKDEKFAKRLHREIENYKIPKELYSENFNLPQSLSPIFRDIEELVSGVTLPKAILEKLEDSENLIVICSPNSASSPWVNQEILDYKKMYGESNIYPIIIAGEAFAKDSQKECFPPALKYQIDENGNLTDQPSNILASNAIKSEDGQEYAKIKLIAGLLGFDSADKLWGREEKRKRRNRVIWGSVTAVILLIMAGLTVFSSIQKNRAQHSRNEAEKLIEYMLFDLKNKLEPIGKLSILEDIQRAVGDYYQNINHENSFAVLRKMAVHYGQFGDI